MIFEACGSYLEFNSSAVSGKTQVYCLIGDPVDHSLSPAIQNTAFRSAGMDAVYVPFRVRRRELKDAIRGLRAIGVRGFNVTTPHKSHVMRHLDKLDPTAREIGSVNTVVASENGMLTGYNTDGIGAVKALQDAGAPLNETALLFGAGGASRAIAHALARHSKSIRLVNRTQSKAKELERRLRRKYRIDVSHHALLRTRLRNLIEEADIIINGSAMGMDGRADLPIEENWLNRDQWVMDIVYRPPETRLLNLARLAGARTLNGLDMLVSQGACSFELWTGRAAVIAEMRHAVARESLAFAHAKNS